MTNIKVIGEENVVSKVLKPIKLVSYLTNGNQMVPAISSEAKSFKNVELISRNYTGGLDLIFCYNNDRNKGDESYLYLGNWNDGVV